MKAKVSSAHNIYNVGPKALCLQKALITIFPGLRSMINHLFISSLRQGRQPYNQGGKVIRKRVAGRKTFGLERRKFRELGRQTVGPHTH